MHVVHSDEPIPCSQLNRPLIQGSERARFSCNADNGLAHGLSTQANQHQLLNWSQGALRIGHEATANRIR